MNRNLVTAFVSVVGSRVVGLVASTIITPILVRLLTPASYGDYATLMAVFGLLMILVSSGVNGGTRKFISEEREMEFWKEHVFGFYARLAAVLAVVAAVGLVLAQQSGLVRVTLGADYGTYFYLLAALTVAAQFRSHVRRTIMGLKMEHISEPLEVLHRVAFGVIAIALLLVGYGIEGVLAGHIAASLVVILVGSVFLSRHLSLSTALESTPESFPRQEMFNFNHLATLNVLLIMSLYHVDVLMLSVVTGESDLVGFYRAALVLTQLLWLVSRSVEGVMIQSTSDLWKQGDVGRIEDIATRATRYTLLFTALLTLGLGALATDFVPLYYGASYDAAILPVVLLLPGALGFAVARPMIAISQSKGDLRPVIAATGASALVNFMLNAALIPQFGMAGAAVATSIGYGSLPVFHVVAARHLGYDPFSDARLRQVAVTVALSAIVVFGLATQIQDPLVSVAVVPFVGFAVYSVLALATGALGAEELFEIGVALPSPVGDKVAAVRRRFRESDGLVRAML